MCVHQLAHLRRLSIGQALLQEGEPTEMNRIRATRALLAQAGLLPVPRRHELLDAAANLPELAALFQPAAAAAAAAAASDTGADSSASTSPVSNIPSPSELQSKLQALEKAVRAAPASAVGRESNGVEGNGSAESKVPQTALESPQPKDVDSGLTPGAAPGAAPAAAPGAAPGAAPAAVGAATAAEEVDVLSISVVPEYDQYGLEAEAVRAVVSIKAIADVPERARVALTCVLDRSGSMSGGPIRLVRETCHFLIDQLTSDDFLGLISYAHDVREDLPLLRMTPASRTLAHAVVEELVAGGSTALYDGLVAGLRQQMAAERDLGGGNGASGGASDSSSPSSLSLVHSCFLFTDGQATDGPSNPASIIEGLQAAQAPSGQHVTVHTFGFGNGHSVELLQQVAEAQSGVYYYISCEEDIACGFGDALGGLLAVVAKDVRVEVRPRSGATLAAFRSGGRVLGAASATTSAATITSTTSTNWLRSRNRLPGRSGGAGAGADGSDAAVPTGAIFNDMFAEETRECLLVLNIGPVAASAPEPQGQQQGQPSVERSELELVVVDLQYTDVATGRRVERSATLRVHRTAEQRPAGQLPAELVFVTAARFETLDAIEAAQRAAVEAEGGDVGPAHQVLDAQVGRLQASPLQVPQLSALVEQTQLAKATIVPRAMRDQAKVAAMAGTVQVLKQQRLATSTVASPLCYEQYDLKCKMNVRLSARAAVSGESSTGLLKSLRAPKKC
ncbi:hypothetical protein VOLCADRAFT_103646 [Volvox carteri f. nagariensis]|uniref:VWFA domain-containing protein n=1 Tax=Volvox carteri f. nagariensis TaxID=3068 RepID=D8TNL5_VOLCA|nr:uncharacterized protein VOLCADRAFT_103646 [Volvox carteri f. nagariensis]EFJ50865.1 hypothetical protein VOLCADRAFT_103646 [Volvox carteri f. nagariensis]|eukprot:XP_002947877.1 hypothetical protein VOLCADRAFT_103646 [Volvox carteri f. nagariensis]